MGQGKEGAIFSNATSPERFPPLIRPCGRRFGVAGQGRCRGEPVVEKGVCAGSVEEKMAKVFFLTFIR